MSDIIDINKKPRLGIFSEQITNLNYPDYPLETSMGIKIPFFLGKYFFNQFCFIGITGKDYMAGLAVIDLKYAANAFFYIYQRHDKQFIEIKKTCLPFKSKIFIGTNPAVPEFYFRSDKLDIHFSDSKIMACGDNLKLDAKLDLQNKNPLRLCTRAGYRGWVYTEKTAPVDIKGSLSVNGTDCALESPETFALMDWTGGYMRRHTFWNWAAAASALPGGRKLGLNFSWGVNETGWTENAFWIDNAMTKCGNVIFEFDSENLMNPWKIYSEDEKIDLWFYPEAKKSEKIQAGIAASRFTQLSGFFSGHLKSSEGEIIKIENIPGWAEDHYSKW